MNEQSSRDLSGTGVNAHGARRLPPPPYLVQGERMVEAHVRFEPELIRRILPDGLQMADTATGVLKFVEADDGWGLGAFTLGAAIVHVKGFDSPDGSSAKYYFTGFASGLGYELHSRAFTRDYLPGFAAARADGRDLRVSFGPDGGGDYLALTLRMPATSAPATYSGVANCLATHPSRHLTFAPVPYAWEVDEAEVVGYEVNAPSDHIVSRLLPTAFLRTFVSRRFNYTLGFARQLTSAGHRSVEAIFGLLSRLGRGAILVEETGCVLFVNDIARQMLGTGLSIRSNLLTANGREGREALSRILGLALDGARGLVVSDVAVLPRGEGRKPLLAMALPAVSIHGPDGTGRIAGAAIVLVTDPERASGGAAPSQILELLGLTPAEARIAYSAGMGLGRRAVADALGITESTVRTTLTVVYSKLGISRQAELAVLASHLAHLA